MYGAIKCDRLNKSVPKVSFVTDKSVRKDNNNTKQSSTSPTSGTTGGGVLHGATTKNQSASLIERRLVFRWDQIMGGGEQRGQVLRDPTPSNVHQRSFARSASPGRFGGHDDASNENRQWCRQDCAGAGVRDYCERDDEEPVSVQADGEPMGFLTSATKIAVKRYEKLVFVRCRRSEVDSTASVGLGRK